MKEKIKKVLDSIFKNDPFYLKLFSSKENYWIIDKIANKRYGPYTKNEFENECRNQNIQLEFHVK